MSAEQNESFEESYPVEYAESLEVTRLAEYLEQFALSYDEDYAEGLEDGCIAQTGTIDLGGELTTTVTFKAERTREEIYKAFYGDVIMTEYEVKSVIRQSRLCFASFPRHIQECIEEMDDFDEGFLQEDTTQFAIGYELTHAITTQGDMLHEQALIIYVDDQELKFPDALAIAENDENYDDGSNDIEDDDPVPDSMDALIDTVTDTELGDVIDFEDLLAFDALAKVVVSEHNNSEVLYRFYRQIDTIRYATQPAHMSMVRNIVEQLFLDEAA